MRVLLISTYELGRQPFGLASPAAWLHRAGFEVECADTTQHKMSEAAVLRADVLAFYLPMHTATRISAPLISRVREVNPAARLAAYGLYAPLNELLLRSLGVEFIMGGEFEQALVEFVEGIANPHPVSPKTGETRVGQPSSSPVRLDKLEFIMGGEFEQALVEFVEGIANPHPVSPKTGETRVGQPSSSPVRLDKQEFIMGGEFEQALVEFVEGIANPHPVSPKTGETRVGQPSSSPVRLDKLEF